MDYKVAKFLRFFLERYIHKYDPRSVLENEDFPWHQTVESYCAEIQKEALKISSRLNQVANFNDILPDQRALKQDGYWKSFFLIALKKDIPNHQLLCPQTTKALKKIPNILNAFFSFLEPKVKIPPHRGPYAGIMRYHLGISIPEGDVAIKVDDQICRWSNGKSLFFDDSFQHEVWNNTNQLRIILFVDFIRPLPPPLSWANHLVLKSFQYSKAARSAYEKVMGTQLS